MVHYTQNGTRIVFILTFSQQNCRIVEKKKKLDLLTKLVTTNDYVTMLFLGKGGIHHAAKKPGNFQKGLAEQMARGEKGYK